VYRISDNLAAVLTLDFFTPVVDDPYEFGCIAAANALSDVFAMGGTVRAAMNILAFPRALGTEVVAQVLRGGASKVTEAGAFVVGGHTIEDDEPKYGLSVFGTVDPERIIKNEGAQAGDVLFYTKQLGTGIMNSAFKAHLETDETMRPVIEAMMELNQAGALAMQEVRPHAATDVTGFGIAGHLHEMLVASNVSAHIDYKALPLFPGVHEYSRDYCRPAKSFDLISWAESFVQLNCDDFDEEDARMGVLCDPQTSGGLLVAVAPQHADEFSLAFEKYAARPPARIGEIVQGEPGKIYVL
jgi:selenide, water dikinase